MENKDGLEKEKRIELQRNEIFRNNVLKFEKIQNFDNKLLKAYKDVYPQHNNFLLKEEFVDLLQKGRNAKVEVYYENWDFEEVEVEKNINYLPKNFNEKEPTMIAPLNKGSICNEINIDSFTIKTSYDYDFLDDKPSSLLYSQNNYYTDCVIIEKNREDIKVYDGLEVMDNDDLLRIVEDEHEGLSVHGDNYYSNFELYSSLLGKDGEKIKWKINKEFKENIKKDLTQDILKVAGSIISKKTDWEKHCLNCYFNDNGIITKEKTIQLFQSWKEEAQKELNKDMKVEKNKSQLCMTEMYYGTDKKTHLNFLQKPTLFSATKNKVDDEDILKYEQGAADSCFKFILSPESKKIPLQLLVRSFMETLQKNTGIKMTWLAVEHHDTNNPHAHILINGVDINKKEFRIPKETIKNARLVAGEICTKIIGVRTKEQIEERNNKSQEKKIDRSR